MNRLSQSMLGKIIKYELCCLLCIAVVVAKLPNKSVAGCTKQPPDLSGRVAMVNMQSMFGLRAANSAPTVLLLNHAVVLAQRYSIQLLVLTVTPRAFISYGLGPCGANVGVGSMISLLDAASARPALPTVSILVAARFREVGQRQRVATMGTLFTINSSHLNLLDRSRLVRTAGRPKPSGCSHSIIHPKQEK